MGRITVTELAERLGVTRQCAHALVTRYEVPSQIKPVKSNGRTSYVRTVLESDIARKLPADRPTGIHRK